MPELWILFRLGDSANLIYMMLKINWTLNWIQFQKTKLIIEFQCNPMMWHCYIEMNLGRDFDDVIHIKDKPLKKGKSLYNLFIQNTQFNSSKAESKQLLESLLLSMGESYLIRNYSVKGESRGLLFFPGHEFLEEGWAMKLRELNKQQSFNTNLHYRQISSFLWALIKKAIRWN